MPCLSFYIIFISIYGKNLIFSKTMMNFIFSKTIMNLIFSKTIINLIFSKTILNLIFCKTVMNLIFSKTIMNLVGPRQLNVRYLKTYDMIMKKNAAGNTAATPFKFKFKSFKIESAMINNKNE